MNRRYACVLTRLCRLSAPLIEHVQSLMNPLVTRHPLFHQLPIVCCMMTPALDKSKDNRLYLTTSASRNPLRWWPVSVCPASRSRPVRRRRANRRRRCVSRRSGRLYAVLWPLALLQVLVSGRLPTAGAAGRRNDWRLSGHGRLAR